MRVKRSFGEIEADVAAAGAAHVGPRQRQVECVGNEVGGELPSLQLFAGGEIVGLAGKAALEIVILAENEIEILEEIDNGGSVRHRHIAHRRLPGPVEMLMPTVDWNAENGAGLPLERDAPASMVPDGGRAAAVEDEDHFLVHLPVRRELPGRRDLADIAVVHGARGIVVEENAAAAAPLPALELDGAQITHVLRADEVEPLAAHPAQIGRILLGFEFLREIVGGDRIRTAWCKIVHFVLSMMAHVLAALTTGRTPASDWHGACPAMAGARQAASHHSMIARLRGASSIARPPWNERQPSR